MTVLSHRDASFGIFTQTAADDRTPVHELVRVPPHPRRAKDCADFSYLRKNAALLLAL